MTLSGPAQRVAAAAGLLRGRGGGWGPPGGRIAPAQRGAGGPAAAAAAPIRPLPGRHRQPRRPGTCIAEGNVRFNMILMPVKSNK